MHHLEVVEAAAAENPYLSQLNRKAHTSHAGQSNPKQYLEVVHTDGDFAHRLSRVRVEEHARLPAHGPNLLHWLHHACGREACARVWGIELFDYTFGSFGGNSINCRHGPSYALHGHAFCVQDHGRQRAEGQNGYATRVYMVSQLA